ncbi:MAG: spermidine synthase, partial [Myxococcota bacterium]
MTRAIALVLTAMTGFSGLVYEVAWQKYLATLLGSHSEATAAVLAIFLGGLSIGYWAFGVATHRMIASAQAAGLPPRLLFVYGGVEFAIGLYVVAFPWLFEAIQALSFAIPHGVGGVGFAIDVALTILLIGPASAMMGATIPILTQALAKDLADATRIHAFIYAFNTVGAFAGALAAGFTLIPALGLVNVMLCMGTINLVAGSAFMVLGRSGSAVASLASEAASRSETKETESFRIYAFVALLTGFAMMTLQTAVMRLVSLSFGSSQFTFSMVVAVFVLCIALGSFAVSTFKRIPNLVVAGNQWALFAAFALLYFQVENAPYWVHVLRSSFGSAESDFFAYFLSGFGWLVVVLGIPVMLSGAALPLLFDVMQREADHLGDLAGNLYSWNTVGSLLGALLGGYIFFFWFDLHEIYRIAVGALALAAVLVSFQLYAWRAVTSTAVLASVAVALFVTPTWDLRILYAGLFRSREVLPGTNLGPKEFIALNPYTFNPKTIFHTDDPITSVTATVSPSGPGGQSLSIVVNGKSDGNTYADFPTMGMLATIPALLAEKAENAFVIGWGTGVTAGELSTLDSMKSIVVAEISPGVIEAAPLFAFANHDAISNPKIEIVASDAYRALMRTAGTYDLIISEPSNPWVTGIEMLYSADFLEVAKAKLSPGGVYCQWFHEYETDAAVMEIVLRTYASVFDHVAVWRSQTPDLLLIGFNDPKLALDNERIETRANRPDFREALKRVQINSYPELLAHELLPLGVVHALDLKGPIHTLYRPILNHTAGRAFFRGGTAELPFSGYGVPAQVGRRNSLLRRYAIRKGGELPERERERVIIETCRAHGKTCRALLAEWMSEAPHSPGFKRTRKRVAELVEVKHQRLDNRKPSSPAVEDLAFVSRLFQSNRSGSAPRTNRASSVAQAQKATREYIDGYVHASPFAPAALLATWSSCSPSSSEPNACAEGKAKAEALLAEGL